MNFLNRLFGRRRDDAEDEYAANAARFRRENAARARGSAEAAMTDDERALERYRYLLRTAPPETIEAAHAEAFAQLSPEQRRLMLQELSSEVPERELAGAADDPRSLARVATRAELRRPGTLERTFGNPAMGFGAGGAGIGLGGLMAGSLLSTIAGVVIGSAIADAFFTDSGYDQGFADGSAAGDESGGESGDAGSDAGDSGFGGDTGDLGAEAGDDFGADIGGDVGGDFGGDFGGEF